jgi:hypothetical protein
VAIQRKGTAVNITLETECVEILHALCPSGKSYGHFLSALIRQEERKRAEMRQLRERMGRVVEVGSE